MAGALLLAVLCGRALAQKRTPLATEKQGTRKPPGIEPEKVELIQAAREPSPAPSPTQAPSPAPVRAGVAREQDPREIFMRGNSLYEAGNYEEAKNEYERLVRAGYRSGNLYYNLGNAYFKLDRKGEAILYYLKCLKILPRDQDASSNLEYALSLIQDRIEPKPQAWLAKQWDAAVSYFSLRELIAAAMALYWILASLLLVIIYAPAWRRSLYRAAGILLIALLVSASGAVTRAYLDGQEEAVILAREAKVHYGPSEGDVVAFVLHEGTVAEIQNAKADWLQVSLPDGKAGWVRREQCGLI